MANPYTTTIIFPEETLATGDTWQLILTFSTALDDTAVSVGSDDAGVKILILDHGISTWDYDFENRLLVPGSTQLVLADTVNYIHNFIFLYTAVSEATDKRFKVDILLNGNNEFNGYVLEDTFEYSSETKILKFTAAPKFDILKNIPLYNDDGDTENPFSYTLGDYALITSMIDDIYSLVSPGITGVYHHDWLFEDENGVQTHEIEDLMMQYNTLYNNSDNQLDDLTALLKNFADTFVCKTGILNDDTYFFEKLGFYSTTNTQTITLLNHSKFFKWALLKYVQFRNNTGAGYSKISYGDYTNLESARIIKTILPYAMSAAPGWTGDTTNIYVSDGGGGVDEIWLCKDPLISTNPPAGPFFNYSLLTACAVFKQWRQDIKNIITHEFKCSGVDYDMTKTVIHDGGYYQINSLTKDWEKEETTMECFYCGAVA